MTARITTRAGRKIRHVAPGHVVDVATGISLHRANGNWYVGEVTVTALDCAVGTTDLRIGNLSFLLGHRVAIAAGICALVRWLTELGREVKEPGELSAASG